MRVGKQVGKWRNMTHKEAPWEFVEKYYTDDLGEIDSPESKFYLSWLKLVKGNSVLSLGCGPNLYNDVLVFGKTPKEIVGIDINKNNIDFLKKSKHTELLKCKQLLLDKGVKKQLIVDDILKYRRVFSGYFDCVYAVGVVGMFKDEQLKKLLENIYSYLKPNGTFIDVDWTDHQLPKEKYEERFSFDWYSKDGPSIEDIGKYIKQSGFSIKQHKVYDVPNKKEYLWGKIYGYFAQKPLRV